MTGAPIYYIAYRDSVYEGTDTMVPVTYRLDGSNLLQLYLDKDAARRAAGTLGVVVPVTREGIKRTLDEWPKLTRAGVKAADEDVAHMRRKDEKCL